MPLPSLQVMSWKRAIHKYVHIYTYIYMWKALYQNPIFELGICIASSFSGMVLNAFWKRAPQICMAVLWTCSSVSWRVYQKNMNKQVSMHSPSPLHTIRVVYCEISNVNSITINIVNMLPGYFPDSLLAGTGTPRSASARRGYGAPPTPPVMASFRYTSQMSII